MRGAAPRNRYLYPNSTNASNPSPPSAGELVAVQLETLVSIHSTMAQPARNITLTGVGVRDAADVTLKPWGVPSGGDWGLYRGAAVFVEGCEGCKVRSSELFCFAGRNR